MPQKENNHYVPRLILRKFDEKISTYNLDKKELKLSQNLEKVFTSKQLYSVEIEDMFNYKVENEFARLLNNKILLAQDECILIRKEVNLVKKFLLLAMLRTMLVENYSQERAIKHRETVKINYNFEENNEITALSKHDYWMQTLRCILEVKSLQDVSKNELSTAFAVYWSNVFMSSYIAIWDSCETNEEFIIMDQGMTSEHEKTRFIPQLNNDMIKRGYLMKKLFFDQAILDPNLLNKYMQISLANDGFSENMYLFTISKNRTIALVNPFFRLYDLNDWKNFDNPEIPNIWTTSIKERSLFEKNKNEYVSSNAIYTGTVNEFDKFTYKIKRMQLDDVIYINCLTLDRIQNIVGFSESSGILRSLLVYSCIPRTLNKYDGLIHELSNLGYNTKVTDEIIRISSEIRIDNIVFTTEEHDYINVYLKLKEIIKNKNY